MVSSKIFLCIILCLCPKVEPNPELMKKVMRDLVDAVKFCAVKNNVVPMPELTEMIENFWNVDVTPPRDFGCELLCAFNRLELIDSEQWVSKENIALLLQSHDAEEHLTNRIIDMTVAKCSNHIQTCEDAMDLTLCFRERALENNLLPFARSTSYDYNHDRYQ